MDTESSSWIASLDEAAPDRYGAIRRLHQMLLKAALHEAHRRGPRFGIGGPELTDIAHQSADDALIAILAKIRSFRGESRFTTWAFRFVALEVANKLGRHFSRRPTVSLDVDERQHLLAQIDSDPLAHTLHRELVGAVIDAITEKLTAHQRRLFIAIVIDQIPMDAVIAQTGLQRGAIYKTVFDARRKIRAHLTANGCLDGQPSVTRPSDEAAGARNHDRVVGMVRATPRHRSA